MLKITVDTATQTMQVFDNAKLLKEYKVSTAANGVGEQNGSEQTPRGRHVIRAKIGAGCQPDTVFVARRPTGEIYQRGDRELYPERDWILTRIMWLCGQEPGKNRFGLVDTMRRYVYIHGTPDEVEMGAPGSRGCIRMRNADIIELFELTPVGSEIIIL